MKTSVLVVALAVSAVMMSLALRSTEGRWLGWITLVPLFLAIQVFSPLRATLAGAFWGLCLWLAVTLGGAGPFAPSALSLSLLTLVPGAYAGIGSWLTRRVGFSPLLLGLGWVGVELALKPLALHHGLLAGTQGDGLFIRTMGWLAGSAVVAFLVAYVNASILEMLRGVCTVVESTRLVSGPGGAVRTAVPHDFSHLLFHQILPSQPRAPPAASL